MFGNGESLADEATGGGGGPPSPPPYTMVEARRVIRPLVAQAAKEIHDLPMEACPLGEAIVKIIMHPRYISKSSFPEKLLTNAGLRAVGTRQAEVTPRKPSQPGQQPSLLGPPTVPTTEIFVAGPRAAFDRLAKFNTLWADKGAVAGDWVKVENWVRPSVESKIRTFDRNRKTVLFEAVLHAGEGDFGERIVEAFRDFVKTLRLTAEIENRVDVAGLSYIVVESRPNQVESIASFEFLRAIREMPRLRMPECEVQVLEHRTFPVKFPTGQVVDPGIRCLIPDGGLMLPAGMAKYVSVHDAEGVAEPVPEFQRHGMGVTSAALFGLITPSGELPTPFARVEHWRVLDVHTFDDAQRGCHTVLNRIRKLLKARKPEFVCCSLGPDEPVDEDINPWTATFDELLAPGKTLAFVATGNNGEADRMDYLNVVQPPADGVNLLSVGSCDSQSSQVWQKAPYSADGDSRNPGRLKPDGLAFGGTKKNPFWVIDQNNSMQTVAVQGSSFAAPLVMRSAVGVKAILGVEMTPLVLKTLLTHTAESAEYMPRRSQGWGRFCIDIPRLIECAASCYTIVYNGVLKPKSYKRLNIAMPKALSGAVTIKATLCFTTAVDPPHPCNYSRSAIEVTFRTDKGNMAPGKLNAPPTPFFGNLPGMTESQLRQEMKWETSQRATKQLEGDKLVEPVFDLHYVPRENGHDTYDAPEIPYAMIVTVEALSHPAPHSAIARRYADKLSILAPVVDIDIWV
jgi:hypothetical protein